MSALDFRVVETDLGPMLNGTRVSIYDILLAQIEGQDLFHICVNYNLKPVQVQVAFDYIEAHRNELDADLQEILPKKQDLSNTTANRNWKFGVRLNSCP